MDELARLKAAAEALYFAGYWHCDRPVDEVALWTELRDAAGIKPGQTAERLGADLAVLEVDFEPVTQDDVAAVAQPAAYDAGNVGKNIASTG